MNFNNYYQSFNNEMYEPINHEIQCIIFILNKGEKVPYLDVFYYNSEESNWTPVWYPLDEDDEEIKYIPVKDKDVVEFLPIYPINKFPAKRRNDVNQLL
jgi:hypothetical protein